MGDWISTYIYMHPCYPRYPQIPLQVCLHLHADYIQIRHASSYADSNIDALTAGRIYVVVLECASRDRRANYAPLSEIASFGIWWASVTSEVWFGLFNGKSTPYGLFNVKIWLICKYLMTILFIFSMFNCIKKFTLFIWL